MEIIGTESAYCPRWHYATDDSSRRKNKATSQNSEEPFGIICGLCQILHEFKEWWRLADEKPHRCQELEGAHSSPLCLRRTNDRTYWEALAEKWAWLRHNQVGLEVLPAERRGIEIRKHQTIRGVSQRRRIACLIMPGLKMSRLGWSDAE